MVNERYRGNFSVAITRLGDDYNILIGINRDDLAEKIDGQIEVFGNTNYKVLRQFNGVSVKSTGRIFESALSRLRKRLGADLDSLLD